MKDIVMRGTIIKRGGRLVKPGMGDDNVAVLATGGLRRPLGQFLKVGPRGTRTVIVDRDSLNMAVRHASSKAD